MLLPRRISELKAVLWTQDSKRIFANFISLVLIQGTNFILPVIVLPYLVHILGIGKFGFFALAQSFVVYWIMVTDYGFNLSTTREIALYRHDRQKLSQIVSRTLMAKLVLVLLSLVGFVLLVNIIPTFSAQKKLYLLSFSMVLGQSLLPVWFFQGIEQMKVITYINLLSKTILTLSIFVFIRNACDYVYVSVFYGLGSGLAGICGLYIMFRKYRIAFRFPGFSEVWLELKNGWYIFLSNFFINIYINSNLFILGFFGNEVVVGYYSIAEKIVSIVRQLLSVYFQATYPALCKQVRKGHQQLVLFFRNFFVPFALVVALLCLAIFLFAGPISVFFAHKSVNEISEAIRWMVFVPLIVCFNIPAFQTLLAYNYQKSYMVVYAIASVINLLFNLVLVHYFQMFGTIATIMITELFVTAALHFILINRHSEQRIIFRNFKNAI